MTNPVSRPASELVRIAKSHIAPGEIEMLEQAGILMVEAKSEGAYVWGKDGKRFLDCRNDAGSFNVGRKNPRVIRAIELALRKHDLGDNFYVSDPKAELAEKLGKLSPQGKLDCMTFGAGGGEIIDFAIKLARGYTGRKEIISAKKAYHGVTGFSLSATGEKIYQKHFKPLAPGFTHVRFNDLKALKQAINRDTAAVLLEPVQGEGGVHVPSAGYLPAVRELCDRMGALLIIDEIQTGLGRTGKMFCVEHADVVPDIMTLGKSLSGGIYPITAALYKREIQSFLRKHPFIHFSSFGGSDLGCVAALAAIEEIERKNLVENAWKQGRRILDGFRSLQKKYPRLIREARGLGLELGLEMRRDKLGKDLSAELFERGVLAPFGVHQPTLMRFLPSLVIDQSDADFLLGALEDSLFALSSMSWFSRWVA